MKPILSLCNNRHIICLLLSLIFTAVHSPVQSADDAISNAFSKQLALFPQDKIYVHTDKSSYNNGESIWFRAYVMDAASMTADTSRQYLYAELINPVDSVVQRVKIRPENNIYSGRMPIMLNMPSGIYELCFYTRYMENSGKEFFYRKKINISDPGAKECRIETNLSPDESGTAVITEIRFLPERGDEPIIPDEIRITDASGQTRSVNTVEGNVVRLKIDPQKELKNNNLYLEYDYIGQTYKTYIPIILLNDDYDVAFLPEGGDLPAGVSARIAFKALKSNGLGERIQGYILTEQGDTITKIASNYLGMGAFQITADPNESYFAVCKNSLGKEKRFALPAAKNDVVSLCAVSPSTDTLAISVIYSANSSRSKDMYLFAHTFGKAVYSAPLIGDTTVKFYKYDLPTGIIHFVLLDNNMNPVSERLIFNSRVKMAPKVSITNNKDNYGKREQIQSKIIIEDSFTNKLRGNLSVSVTNDYLTTQDSTNNIMSTLLLTSELKGYVENPASYFRGDSTRSRENLDVLMMTQGWSRYNIPAVLKGDFATPSIPRETSFSISGRVTNLKGNKPVANGTVTMLQIGGNRAGSTTTDAEGRFVFQNMNIPDSTRYMLQAVDSKGSNTNCQITMDELSFTNAVLKTPYGEVAEYKTDMEDAGKIIDDNGIEIESIYTDSEGNQVRNIKEIVVRARRTVEPPRAAAEYSIYSSPFNDVLKMEEPEKNHDIFFFLAKLPGVRVYATGNGKPKLGIAKGSGRENVKSLKIFVDGIETSEENLNLLPSNVIKEVELMTGSRLAMFGTEGGGLGGAIIVTTIAKTGLDFDSEIPQSPGSINYSPFGFQTSKEFYSPRYETVEQKQNETPDQRSTLYWNPFIKTTAGGLARIDFYSADTPSTYTIIIEGITHDGRPIYHKQKINSTLYR